ncbi:ATP-dependent DNA helicase [Trichonephila clavipes]|nr:ATP-dependent DNA helicase [Trichonephila clavipes]
MPNVIEATILSGQADSKDVFIPKIHIIPSDVPFQWKQLQFLIQLCFAMSINKAQGQSLQTVGAGSQKSCFSHGLFYVFCSRKFVYFGS